MRLIRRLLTALSLDAFSGYMITWCASHRSTLLTGVTLKGTTLSGGTQWDVHKYSS